MFNSEIPKSFFSPVNSSNDTLSVLGIRYAEITNAGIPIIQTDFIITLNKNEEIRNSLMSLMNAERNNEILKNALRNSIKARRLSDEYIYLLQEKLSDDDFNTILGTYEKISAPYAFEARSLPAKEIALEAKILLDAIEDSLGSNALTEYSLSNV